MLQEAPTLHQNAAWGWPRPQRGPALHLLPGQGWPGSIWDVERFREGVLWQEIQGEGGSDVPAMGTGGCPTQCGEPRLAGGILMKRAKATLKPSALRELSLLPALLSATPLPLCVLSLSVHEERGLHTWSQQSTPTFLHEQPAQNRRGIGPGQLPAPCVLTQTSPSASHLGFAGFQRLGSSVVEVTQDQPGV